MEFIHHIKSRWSSTNFQDKELTTYAEHFVEDEVRSGIFLLAMISLLLLSSAAVMYALLGFSNEYIYTFSLLAILALHIAVSSRFTANTDMLYLLGIALLVISGSAFVLLAHKTGSFSDILLSSTVLLFMLIPLASWGLREATIVVVLIYLEFTLSSISVAHRFESQTIWQLQFLMLGASMTALTLVARSVGIRKSDIQTHFEIIEAHKKLELLSNKDPLTGAWNRRFMEENFPKIIESLRKKNKNYFFAIIDIDNFKTMNDSYGHIFGDKALQYISKTLLNWLNEDSFLFRLGGDEFVLLFSDDDSLDDLKIKIKEMHLIPVPDHPEYGDINMFISMGLISIKPKQDVYLELLYRQADRVLYRAKILSKKVGGQNNIVSRPCLITKTKEAH